MDEHRAKAVDPESVTPRGPLGRKFLDQDTQETKEPLDRSIINAGYSARHRHRHRYSR